MFKTQIKFPLNFPLYSWFHIQIHGKRLEAPTTAKQDEETRLSKSPLVPSWQQIATFQTKTKQIEEHRVKDDLDEHCICNECKQKW